MTRNANRMLSHSFHDCCNAVLIEAKPGNVSWQAVQYAQKGKWIADIFAPAEATWQHSNIAACILGRISGLRSPRMRDVKRCLNRYAEGSQ